MPMEMLDEEKNEHANALKEVKRLCKEFDFTAGMLMVSIIEDKKNEKPIS